MLALLALLWTVLVHCFHLFLDVLRDAIQEAPPCLFVLEGKSLHLGFRALVLEVKFIKVTPVILVLQQFLVEFLVELACHAFLIVADVHLNFDDLQQVFLPVGPALELVFVSDTVFTHLLADYFPGLAVETELTHELVVQAEWPEVVVLACCLGLLGRFYLQLDLSFLVCLLNCVFRDLFRFSLVRSGTFRRFLSFGGGFSGIVAFKVVARFFLNLGLRTRCVAFWVGGRVFFQQIKILAGDYAHRLETGVTWRQDLVSLEGALRLRWWF